MHDSPHSWRLHIDRLLEYQTTRNLYPTEENYPYTMQTSICLVPLMLHTGVDNNKYQLCMTFKLMTASLKSSYQLYHPIMSSMLLCMSINISYILTLSHYMS